MLTRFRRRLNGFVHDFFEKFFFIAHRGFVCGLIRYLFQVTNTHSVIFIPVITGREKVSLPEKKKRKKRRTAISNKGRMHLPFPAERLRSESCRTNLDHVLFLLLLLLFLFLLFLCLREGNQERPRRGRPSKRPKNFPFRPGSVFERLRRIRTEGGDFSKPANAIWV